MHLVAHVAHAARLDQPGKDGTTGRQALEGQIKRYATDPRHAERVARFEAELDGPPAPVALQYLLQWAGELIGRSGVGFDGLNPLTYDTVAHWARLTGRDPAPHEVHALFLLDAVKRAPPKE